MLTDEELQSLYGTWEPLTPAAAAPLLDPLDWWVVGGWALELATGVSRHHADLDIGVPRSDLQRVTAHLADYHLWTAQAGSLTPLSRFEVLPPDYEQLWVRRNAQSPWVFEVLLTPVDNGEWVYKKDASVRLPMERAVLTTGGIRHLAPEIVLLHKSHLCRPKDDADLEATLPLLDDAARQWLADTVARCQPQSPWNTRLAR